ncbi:MAG: hypothetical protein JEZ07_15840 [Phycisphaerae bacterium]|nr:hypothetical protein [Phycisphaerae bacterium]
MAEKKYNFDLEQTINAYIDGELPSGRADKIEQIISDDPEVRELYEKIKVTAGMISGIPVEAAPQELAENILRDLERDQLLDSSELLTETSGQTHLRFRKFFAAAAVLVLVGAIVLMVFQALSDKPGNFDPKEKDIAANDPPEKNDPELTLPIVKSPVKPEINPILLELVEFTATEQPEAIPFSTMRLQIETNVETARDRWLLNQQLDGIFAYAKVEDIITDEVPGQKLRYSFMCDTDTFAEVFKGFGTIDEKGVAVYVPAPFGDGEFIARNVSVEEAVELAFAGDDARQAYTMLAMIPSPRLQSPLQGPLQWNNPAFDMTIDPSLFDINILSSDPIVVKPENEQSNGLSANDVDSTDAVNQQDDKAVSAPKPIQKVAVILEILIGREQAEPIELNSIMDNIIPDDINAGSILDSIKMDGIGNILGQQFDSEDKSGK